MDSERYRIVKTLLNEALDRPAGARSAYLNQACPDDPELRAEVEALLDEPVETGFLEGGPLALDPDEDDDRLIGRTLGRIRITALIARGGMGVVYEGMDELLGRPVAVKVIRGERQLSESSRAALLDEARLLSGVGHPNICELHDFFIEDDLDVLVMERVEGRTLRQALERGSIGAPVAVALQIVDALVSAHERGIAHLDLKPENVMLTASGQVKVLDFGVARPVVKATGGANAAPAAGASAFGTPGYHAPEQARGLASTASDLWSFGIVLLELLSDVRDRSSGRRNRTADGPPPIPERLPRAERRLLERLLSRDPSRRPTARDAREALLRIEGRSRRRLISGLAAGLLAILLFAGYRYTTDLQFERNEAHAARAEAEELAGFMVVDLYDGLLSVGRLDLLEPVALKAVEYYGRLEPERDEPGSADAALALLRVGEVLELQGHQRRSIDALARAESALAALVEHHPEDEVILYRHALAQLALGTALRYAGEQDRAEVFSFSALDTARQLTEDQVPVDSEPSNLQTGPGAAPVSPTASERWALLLRALYERADGAFRTGRGAEAMPWLNEALAVADARLPQHPALAENLGDIRWLTCMVHYDQRIVPGVVDACRASLALDRERYLASPDDLSRMAFYFDANWSLVNAYRLTGQHEASLELAMYAESLAERLIARDPDRFHNQNRLAVILVSKARALRALGNDEAMRASLERVLEITAPLMGDAELVAVNNRLTALALLGRLDKARPLAREIYAGGWRQREFLDLCRQFGLLPECAEAKLP